MKRLREELKEATASNPYFRPSFPDLYDFTTFSFIISADDESIYGKRDFKFTVHFPDSYPRVAMKVRCVTPIFHPNISEQYYQDISKAKDGIGKDLKLFSVPREHLRCCHISAREGKDEKRGIDQSKMYHSGEKTLYLQKGGSVCLSILREDYSPKLTIDEMVQCLFILLLEPNPKDPLNSKASKVSKTIFSQMAHGDIPIDILI
ncbi:hypothetical protein ADUPG1_012243 [Aduncisulcus paluster]|uniref:UBC core domain-containing protein n=1 Tax=Aduncisulcus paluster TaxID=2918883 RepID=A0ABQ5JYR9_9EUKA|nr:hypothetical protein ADUPG1_012243 [Aduncisulcus paluster]